MPFRRTDVAIPEHPVFSGGLADLGFRVDLGGHVVSLEPPNEYFEFAKYEEHETNQQRYNAVHKAVRDFVHGKLATADIKPRYVYMSDDGTKHHLTQNKPDVPSIKILGSHQSSLFKRKELYLIIGDSKQDLAIWSRKAVLTETGVCHGSAIEVVAQLRRKKTLSGAKGFEMSEVTKQLTAKKATRPSESNIPGVVLLNPGELLYSHKAQDCMTAASWQDQRRKHAFSDQYKIIEAYNTVLGHKTAVEHVESFLREHLDAVMGPETHLNIIAMGDASEAVLGFLNKAYSDSAADNPFEDRHLKIALIEPTHDAGIVTDPKLQEILSKHGRAWEAHSAPPGTLLKSVAPEIVSPPLSFPEVALQSFKQEVATQHSQYEGVESYKFRHDVLTQHGHGLKGEMALGIGRPRHRRSTKPIEMDSKELRAELAVLDQPRESSWFSHFMMRTLWDILRNVTTRGTLLSTEVNEWRKEAAKEDEEEAQKERKKKKEDDDDDDEDEYDDYDPKYGYSYRYTSRGFVSAGPPGSEKEQTNGANGGSEHESASEEDPDHASAYPYAKERVNCATYSAGVEETVDMIIPKVMGEVVRFFEEGQESREAGS